jgi:hypothetical protein
MKPDILLELQQLAPALVTISRQPVFEVPPGYFEQLSGAIMFNINKLQTPDQEVPKGYFEGLAGSIMQRIKTEEAAEQQNPEYSAVLNGIGKQMPFAVPEGYFSQLPATVLSTVQQTEQPAAKVVQLGAARRKGFGWFKYAAAACVVGLLGFFAVRMFSTSSPQMADKENMVIPGTIWTYKQIKETNVAAELENVNSAEATNFLCQNGIIACNDPKNEDLEQQLSEISDEDLDAFLEAQN